MHLSVLSREQFCRLLCIAILWSDFWVGYFSCNDEWWTLLSCGLRTRPWVSWVVRVHDPGVAVEPSHLSETLKRHHINRVHFRLSLCCAPSFNSSPLRPIIIIHLPFPPWSWRLFFFHLTGLALVGRLAVLAIIILSSLHQNNKPQSQVDSFLHRHLPLGGLSTPYVADWLVVWSSVSSLHRSSRSQPPTTSVSSSSSAYPLLFLHHVRRLSLQFLPSPRVSPLLKRLWVVRLRQVVHRIGRRNSDSNEPRTLWSALN